MNKNYTVRHFLTSLIILLFSAGNLYSQIADVPINYVSEAKYLSSTVNITGTTYFDGLGRELQKIERYPNGKQVVSNTKYDVWGRIMRTYLPYPAVTSSGFAYNAETEQKEYYRSNFNSDYAFSHMNYDNTTKENLIEQSQPGDSWKIGGGHTARTSTSMNTAGDKVKIYSLYTDGTGVLYTGFYDAGELVKTELTDPQGDITCQYYDRQKNLISEEVRTIKDTMRTYYLYDEAGLLRYVIPPIADYGFKINGPRNLRDLQRYCFFTEYDDMRRPYKKYVPGAGYTINLYDNRDRLVLSQSENLREEGKWVFTKYDDLNRAVITGICSGTEEEHKTALAAQTVFGETRNASAHGYTDLTYPTGVNTNDILTVTYYDNYDWQGEATGASAVAAKPDAAFTDSKTEKVYGLVTGNKYKVIGIDGNKWLYSATYYDDKYNVIHSVKELYPSGLDVVYGSFDFIGNPTRIKEVQTINYKEEGYDRYYEYDHLGRLTEVKQKVLGSATEPLVSIAKYKYNDLSQMIEKYNHNGIDTTRFKYSMDGKVTGVDSPVFSYDLYFDKKPEEFNYVKYAPRYDGNISLITWESGGEPQAYAYTYDELKQFNLGTYALYRDNKWSPKREYMEQVYSYDRAGNITDLMRKDNMAEQLHDIRSTYDGNKLTKANINGTDYSYTYDKNGNMTFDGYKGINIAYNILNLPEKIFAGSDEVVYIYNSVGEKLATKVGSSFTYYRGDFVYNNGYLNHMRFPEGIIKSASGGYAYYYIKTDHLGSTRVLAYPEGTKMTAFHKTDYYPFGLPFKVIGTNYNRYLFSGKEIQDQTIGGKKLMLFDFGARNYDPTIARWFNIDPALQFTNPYTYCANNPIRFVDPDGRVIQITAFLPGTSSTDDKFLNYTWEKLEIGWAFYNDEHGVYNGDDQFINSLTQSLTSLMEGGRVGRNLVKQVAKNKKVLQIKDAKQYGSYYSDTDNTIWWNSTGYVKDNKGKISQAFVPTTSGKDLNNAIALGHELFHTKDHWNNTLNEKTWFWTLDTNNNFKKVTKSEIYATYGENMLRAEQGLPLRTHYAITPDGYGTGPRIIDLEGKSMYFNTDGITNYRRVKKDNRFPF